MGGERQTRIRLLPARTSRNPGAGLCSVCRFWTGRYQLAAVSGGEQPGRKRTSN